MLSYETKKMDYLVSKDPPDRTKKVKTSAATRVSEEAAKAAIERKDTTPYRPHFRHNEEKLPLKDSFVYETSRALKRAMPEVLKEPYRVKITENDVKEEENESKEFIDSRLKGMTRAEYIRFVREECAKELAYVPRNQVEVVVEEPLKAEELCHEDPVTEEPVIKKEVKEKPIKESDEGLMVKVRRKKKQKIVTNELPLIMKEKIDEATLCADQMQKEGTAPLVENKRRAFLHKLWIQGIVAMCLFIGLVSFDLLNVRVGSVSIRSVKEIVGNNETIQKIEEVVSDFAENTVLPVFGVDKKEGQ